MKIKRKCWMLCFALMLGLAGCAKESIPAGNAVSQTQTSSENKSILDSEAVKKNQKTAAISMPSKSSEKWIISRCWWNLRKMTPDSRLAS